MQSLRKEDVAQMSRLVCGFAVAAEAAASLAPSRPVPHASTAPMAAVLHNDKRCFRFILCKDHR